MKVQDIQQFMGRSAAALAADFKVSKQSLGKYLLGQRGKPSKFLAELLEYCQLSREEVIFPDRFDHPSGGDPQHPAYWANIALEALEQARQCGLPEKNANEIALAIRHAIEPPPPKKTGVESTSAPKPSLLEEMPPADIIH